MTIKPVGVRAEIAATGEVGILLPLLGDYHAHVQLVDASDLQRSNLGFVLDLGGNPEVLARRASASDEAAGVDTAQPTLAYAGQFLCAPGGYPSDRGWAPEGSVRFVISPEEAESAVLDQRSSGASVIKVTLNAESGPVFDLQTLEAICTVAHRQRIVVVAHAEGAGMVSLALEGGVDALAHSPFREVVRRDVLEACVSRGMAWISTFDIHGYGKSGGEHEENLALALDNAWRFVAAGGQMLYGTDIGNGPLPVGINAREIEHLQQIGLDAPTLVESMSSAWLVRHSAVRPDGARDRQRGSFVPLNDEATDSAEDLVAALTRTRPVSTSELVSFDD